MQRPIALEYQRRGDALRHINTADMALRKNRFCPVKSQIGENGPSSAAQLAAACGALPKLDVLALQYPVPGAPVFVWDLPAPREVWLPETAEGATSPPGPNEIVYRKDFIENAYIFRCSDFRSP